MLSKFVKQRRKAVGLTQPEIAEKAGVGLRFIRELEQGKESLRLDKVNQVLKLFGFELGPVPISAANTIETETASFNLNFPDANLHKS